ncbi:carboxypeptidase-like regulatory domain-containing protein [Desulfobacterales bacterium HSG2]|nr:carboxypeptidase-like regulatory domain-containing protein [Desulfobacterales bacterium HSG2]
METSSFRAFSLISASTDEDGYYEISVYPASEYRVSASGNMDYRTVYYKDATRWEDATLIDASEDSVSGIDFVLKMGPGISGVISGLKAGDTAHIEALDNEIWGWGNTFVEGTDGSDIAFKIRGLEEGDYRINVWAEGYLNGYLLADGTLGRYDDAALIKLGAEDVRIKLDEGKKISGTVSGLSEGDRLWIDAYSESGWGKGGLEVIAEGPTADFTISGLGVASDFRVSVYAEGYLNGSYGGPGSIPVSWEKAVLISTVDGDVSGVDILMSTGNTISGTITGLDEDKETYIYVNAWSEGTGSSGGVSVMGTGSEVTYEIKCLSPADDFRVSVNAEGYLSGYHGAEGTVGWEEAELVDSSSNPTNINIALSKGNTISGTITGLGKGEWAWIEARRENADRFIEPMPLMTDVAMDEGMDMKYDGWCGTGGWGENSWGGTDVIGTGEPIRYTITGLLPADDFIVTFRPEGYAVSTKTDVDTRTDPTDIDFVVSEGKRMSGTIKGAVPGQWISVNAYSESIYDGRYAEVRADSDGNATYEMKGLGEASDYVVSAWSGRKNLFYDQQLSWEDATRVDVSVDSATGIDFDFDGIEMHTISGSIVGLPDKDDTQVWIDAWSETLGGWGNAEISGNGDFTIELPAGEYNLGIYADGYMNAHYDAESDALTDDWADVGRISLTDDVELGELNLSAGYSISGAVTDSEGNALRGVWVEVFSKDKDIGTSAESDRKGEYSISGLSDGTYFVTVWSIDGYHEGEVAIEGSDVTYNITLGGEDTGSVSGVVSGGDVVILFDESGIFVNALETDDSGEYSFNGLAAGSYTVKLKKRDAEDYEVLDTVTVDAD